MSSEHEHTWRFYESWVEGGKKWTRYMCACGNDMVTES